MMMEETSQRQSEGAFALRLIGGIIAGVAILLFLDATYWAVVRIPQAEMMLRDFETAVPRVTVLAMRTRWAGPVLSLCTLLAGLAGAATGRRGWLVGGVMLCLLTAGVLWGDRFAIERPLTELFQAISGQ